jgi:cytochrome c oxidase assembly protein subunit 15
VLLVIVAFAARDRARWRCVRVYSLGLLGVEVVQIVIGIVQAKLGLPVALVNIHLVLAVILVAAITALLLSQRGRVSSL